jgi:cytochrome c5
MLDIVWDKIKINFEYQTSNLNQMYSTIFLVHKVSVILFLLLYIEKTLLLLVNKNELLEKVTKFSKIPEMIISATFLITGVYMITQTPMVSVFTYIKLGCVFAAIPLAIVGFKKKNKILASLALVLIFGAYGLAEMNKSRLKKAYQKEPIVVKSDSSIELGLAVYQRNCQMCHGDNGDAGIAGSANLKTTALTPAQQVEILKNGKNSMPKFNYLSDKELDAVLVYIGTYK